MFDGPPPDAMRRLFAKQLDQAISRDGTVDLDALSGLVCSAYAEAERDRVRTGRAITLMAEEMEGINSELSLQNTRFSVALNHMAHGLMMCASDGRMVVCNARLAKLLGVSQDSLVPGMSFVEIIARDFADPSSRPRTIDESVAEFRRLASRASNFEEVRGGRMLLFSIQPTNDGGCVLTVEDITARRQAESRIAHMARHDILTGLPNRSHFLVALEAALVRARRGENFAVLWMDLDRFKAVNDSLGHPAGDALLCAVTTRMQGAVREVDTVARLGGDEFCILQTCVDQPGNAIKLAQRLMTEISQPYLIHGNHVVVGVSIGIALAPADGDTADTLMKNADLALYRAKTEGRGTWRFFEPDMNTRMQARRMLELDLRRALEEDQFDLAFQPFIDARSGMVNGFEALLRWTHPVRGIVSPADIIPLAEETGIIVDIGTWVLRRACAVAVTWPSHVSVAVNVSAVQFRNDKLFDIVTDVLVGSGLAPERLELEVTETTMLQDVAPTLRRLRRLGVRIALDDFGTGYASLSYLRSFPFDKIKIDQSFVRDLGTRSDAGFILRAIVALGKNLGMQVTAEGVETAAQLAQVTAEGCSDVQGYLLGRPIAAPVIATYMVNRSERTSLVVT